MQIEIVNSPQNKLLKLAVALRQKKYRDEYGLFIVEGVRLCEDFAASDWQGDCCLFTAEAAENPRVGSLLKALAAKGCRLLQAPESIFARITDTEQPQGVMAIVRKRRFSLDGLFGLSPTPFIAVLDGIQDPGNVGTIIRTADAAGCTGVIMTKGCAALHAGKTVRATMGSIFHLPIIDGIPGTKLVNELAKAGIPLAATTLTGADIYHQAELAGALAVVFGNEGQGLGDDFINNSRLRLYIPLYGKAESLNVSAAAAIILYESARQRRLSL